MTVAGGGDGPDRRADEPDWVVRPVPPEHEPPPVEEHRTDAVLEFGAPTEDRPRRRWARAVPLVLAAALLGAFAAYQVHRTNLAAAPAPSAAPSTPAPPSSPARVPAAPSVGPSPIEVTEVGHPLFGGGAGWDLVARGPAGVVRIQPATGRITRTALPPLNSSGPVSLVTGPTWTMVRPLDSVAGYLVPDGQAARELSGELSHGGPVAPGPDGSTVWIMKFSNAGGVMTLVDTLGRPTGPTLAFPRDASGQLTPDGTGYLVFEGIGGAYDVRPDGMHRITTGALVAIGPTRWLVLECDDAHKCSTVVIDRGTGTRRTLNVVTQAYRPLGVVSPDGALAAVTTSDLAGLTDVHLIDLATGADHILPVPTTVSGEDSTMAWSPDDRWLFVAAPTGTLYAIEAASAQLGGVGVQLPPVTQLAVRAAVS